MLNTEAVVPSDEAHGPVDLVEVILDSMDVIAAMDEFCDIKLAGSEIVGVEVQMDSINAAIEDIGVTDTIMALYGESLRSIGYDLSSTSAAMDSAKDDTLWERTKQWWAELWKRVKDFFGNIKSLMRDYTKLFNTQLQKVSKRSASWKKNTKSYAMCMDVKGSAQAKAIDDCFSGVNEFIGMLMDVPTSQSGPQALVFELNKQLAKAKKDLKAETDPAKQKTIKQAIKKLEADVKKNNKKSSNFKTDININSGTKLYNLINSGYTDVRAIQIDRFECESFSAANALDNLRNLSRIGADYWGRALSAQKKLTGWEPRKMTEDSASEYKAKRAATTCTAFLVWVSNLGLKNYRNMYAVVKNIK